MRESEWIRLAGHISRMWPNDPLPKETAVAWYPLLAHLDADQVRTAIDTLRIDPDVRWQPTPGQIIDACTPAAGSWADAVPEIARRLSGADPNYDHPDTRAIGAYIRSLGLTRTSPAVDLSHPTVRAQGRDWWRHWHRQQTTARRRVIATGSRPALEAAS